MGFNSPSTECMVRSRYTVEIYGRDNENLSVPRGVSQIHEANKKRPCELNEILSSYIFPFLQYDRSTILNLALVSQRFKDLAQPILYKTITLKLQAPTKESHYHQEPGSIDIFEPLVSTLKAHSHLRAYVLSLSVFHHPCYERFHSHCSLISLAPNIRTLSLSPPPSTLALTPSDHPHLHSLTFGFGNHHDKKIPDNELEAQVPNFKLALVARHLFLPSLRTFHVDGLYFSHRDLWPVLFPVERHGASQIENLELLRCGDGDIGMLPEMLKCINSLQRFVFETHVPWEVSHMGTPSLTAQSIWLELKPFEQHLTQLCIAASDAADFVRGSGNILSVIGIGKGFREFVNLRILAVPEFFLVGDRDSSTDMVDPLTEEEATESVGRFVDCLPQSIEYLQIQYMHGFQQEEDPHREMAECLSGSEYGQIEGLVALKKTFENVGVDFEWLSEPYWESTPFGEGRFGWDAQLLTPIPQVLITSIKSLSIH